MHFQPCHSCAMSRTKLPQPYSSRCISFLHGPTENVFVATKGGGKPPLNSLLGGNLCGQISISNTEVFFKVQLKKLKTAETKIFAKIWKFNTGVILRIFLCWASFSYYFQFMLELASNQFGNVKVIPILQLKIVLFFLVHLSMFVLAFLTLAAL